MPGTCLSPVDPSGDRPSVREARIAAAVLAGLLAVAGGLLWTQSRFNPAVINFLQGAAGQAKEKSVAAQVPREPILPLPEVLHDHLTEIKFPQGITQIEGLDLLMKLELKENPAREINPVVGPTPDPQGKERTQEEKAG